MHRRHLQLAAIIALGTVLYALLGWGSLRLAVTQANASAVWPLAGLGIGVLARFGIRHWPAILLGAFTTNFLVNLEQGIAMPQALFAALGIAVGNTLEALVGARLVRHALGDPPEFWSVDGVFRFVGLAALLPPMCSAGCGVISLQTAGILTADQGWQTALTWFTGNVAGILTFAPFFLIGPLKQPRGKLTHRPPLEIGLILILILFVGQAMSGVFFGGLLPDWPKTYMAVPLVLWISCRFGRGGSVVGVLLLMVTGVIGTLRNYAAFPAESPEQSLLSLQLFISVLAAVGLTVSVLVHQLRLQRNALEAAFADNAIRLAAVTQEKAILTASAVHELQSPLSGMRNLLQLVRPKPEIFASPQGPRLLNDMQSAVDHMFSLISGALDAARPDATSGPQPCDLNTLIRHAIQHEQSHADSKRIRIHSSMPATSVTLATQPIILEHIVANFLSNAVKFSNPGTNVFVDLEKTQRDITITVTDEGPGIPERDRATIFSGTLRAHRPRPTGGESSTGMGLYLTGELAQRLGAKLTCTGTPIGGTSFAVRIPLPPGNPRH